MRSVEYCDKLGIFSTFAQPFIGDSLAHVPPDFASATWFSGLGP